MTSCVYALTPAPRRGRGGRVVTRGLAGEPLRVVTVGQVSAVVGTLRRRPAPTAESLRRFADVVRRLHEAFPAVLPARFLSCFDDPDELLVVLRARQRSLRRSLAHVRGRAQMTVRVLGVPGTTNHQRRTPNLEPEPEPEPEPGTRNLEPGTAYLRRRARERDVPGFEPVRAAVRRWVRDERVQKSEGVASVYHLVPTGSVAVYLRTLERAAAAAGLRVAVTGPFPPHAFADGLDGQA